MDMTSTSATLLPNITNNPNPPGIEILPFAVPIPSELFHPSALTIHHDDHCLDRDQTENRIPPSTLPQASLGTIGDGWGIVGTITILAQQSIIVWMGYGRIIDNQQDTPLQSTTTIPFVNDGLQETSIHVVGSAKHCSMGPLHIAMPRCKYQGGSAFGGMGEVATSKLVGDDDDTNEVVASQMAARLSKRLQIPVLISCHFDPSLWYESSGDGTTGNNQDIMPSGGRSFFLNSMIPQRAAALAERRICEIVKQREAKGRNN